MPQQQSRGRGPGVPVLQAASPDTAQVTTRESAPRPHPRERASTGAPPGDWDLLLPLLGVHDAPSFQARGPRAHCGSGLRGTTAVWRPRPLEAPLLQPPPTSSCTDRPHPGHLPSRVAIVPPGAPVGCSPTRLHRGHCDVSAYWPCPLTGVLPRGPGGVWGERAPCLCLQPPRVKPQAAVLARLRDDQSGANENCSARQGGVLACPRCLRQPGVRTRGSIRPAERWPDAQQATRTALAVARAGLPGESRSRQHRVPLHLVPTGI